MWNRENFDTRMRGRRGKKNHLKQREEYQEKENHF